MVKPAELGTFLNNAIPFQNNKKILGGQYVLSTVNVSGENALNNSFDIIIKVFKS